MRIPAGLIALMRSGASAMLPITSPHMKRQSPYKTRTTSRAGGGSPNRRALRRANIGASNPAHANYRAYRKRERNRRNKSRAT